MSPSPLIVRTVPALRRALDSFRGKKQATIALVPTMGALHDGHVSLVRLAKRSADKVIVSIFVNPAQFAPSEDFSSYPRTWKSDVAKLAAEKVDAIWNPRRLKTMYPDGFATQIVPEGPVPSAWRIASGRISSVASPPSSASCSRKSGRMLRFSAKGFPAIAGGDADVRSTSAYKVIGSRTVRERDNSRCPPATSICQAEERRVASELYRGLKQSARRLQGGGDIAAAMAGGAEMVTAAGFALDYFEVRHAETLESVASAKDGPLRILVAARLGKTRLIDNIKV